MEGLSATASVITSAALIMILVFGIFAFARVLVMQLLGFGLAVAVLLDATVIRMVLVPAFMQAMGRWNWWPGVGAAGPAQGRRVTGGTPSRLESAAAATVRTDTSVPPATARPPGSPAHHAQQHDAAAPSPGQRRARRSRGDALRLRPTRLRERHPIARASPSPRPAAGAPARPARRARSSSGSAGRPSRRPAAGSGAALAQAARISGWQADRLPALPGGVEERGRRAGTTAASRASSTASTSANSKSPACGSAADGTAPSGSPLGLQPVGPDADVHHQRHPQLRRALHVARAPARAWRRARRAAPRRPARRAPAAASGSASLSLPDRVVDADHGELDQVGGASPGAASSARCARRRRAC